MFRSNQVFSKLQHSLGSLASCQILSIQKDLEIQAISNYTRFLQLLRVNKVRPIKPPTDEGSSLIAMQSKKSFCKHSIFPMLGRQFSHRQFCRLRRIRFLRIPMDGWGLHKCLQFLRINFSSFGTPVKFGVIIRFHELVKSMNFNLSKFYWKKKKVWIISFLVSIYRNLKPKLWWYIITQLPLFQPKVVQFCYSANKVE